MIVTLDYVHDRLNDSCRVMSMPQSVLTVVQMTLAIGLQESDFHVRRQYNDGPAASFWQMERGGGIRGVMNHATSRDRAKILCKHLGVSFFPMDIWVAMQRSTEASDVLGAGFARLLLATDPRPLPALDNPGATPLECPPYPDGGWGYYRWNWRPGKPHPKKWLPAWNQSLAYVRTL